MAVLYRWNGSAFEPLSGPPGPKGDPGATGASGANGTNGTNGWTPVLAVVSDGERRVLQVTDWTGGTGTKPATGQYVSATGLTTTLASAIDIRGAAGPAGTVTAPANMVTTDTAQTLTGLKTIGNGEFDFLRMTAEPPAPATNNITLFAINDASGVTRLKLKYADGTTASMRSVEPYIMAVTGTLAVATGRSRVYLEDNYVIETVRASVNTAPAGASVIVDVNLNGTTVFTTQSARPTIAAGANTATGTPAITSVSTGQYLTVDVDQVGSTTAGADLTVVIRLRRI